MSRFTLNQEDLWRRPALITFAYSKDTAEWWRRRGASWWQQRRSWGEIIELSKVNQWLIFVYNFIITILAAGLLFAGVVTIGFKNLAVDAYCLVLAVIIIYSTPSLVRLFLVIRSHGSVMKGVQK